MNYRWNSQHQGVHWDGAFVLHRWPQGVGPEQPRSCPYPIHASSSMGLCPHPCSWHNSSSSGRNFSCKQLLQQTATSPQIASGHTPRFRAGSDRASQHGITQRTLYFSLKQKSHIQLFSNAVFPLNGLSLTLPVGCTFPSLSYSFIPAIPPFLHLLPP